MYNAVIQHLKQWQTINNRRQWKKPKN
jgi:hypothetical protein